MNPREDYPEVAATIKPPDFTFSPPPPAKEPPAETVVPKSDSSKLVEPAPVTPKQRPAKPAPKDVPETKPEPPIKLWRKDLDSLTLAVDKITGALVDLPPELWEVACQAAMVMARKKK